MYDMYRQSLGTGVMYGETRVVWEHVYLEVKIKTGISVLWIHRCDGKAGTIFSTDRRCSGHCANVLVVSTFISLLLQVWDFPRLCACGRTWQHADCVGSHILFVGDWACYIIVQTCRQDRNSQLLQSDGSVCKNAVCSVIIFPLWHLYCHIYNKAMKRLIDIT